MNFAYDIASRCCLIATIGYQCREVSIITARKAYRGLSVIFVPLTNSPDSTSCDSVSRAYLHVPAQPELG